jgi:hypothetical protein
MIPKKLFAYMSIFIAKVRANIEEFGFKSS